MQQVRKKSFPKLPCQVNIWLHSDSPSKHPHATFLLMAAQHCLPTTCKGTFLAYRRETTLSSQRMPTSYPKQHKVTTAGGVIAFLCPGKLRAQPCASTGQAVAATSWARIGSIHCWLPQPHEFKLGLLDDDHNLAEQELCHACKCICGPSRAGLPPKQVIEEKPDSTGQHLLTGPSWKTAPAARNALIYAPLFSYSPPVHLHMYPIQGVQVTNGARFPSAPKPRLHDFLLHPTPHRSMPHQSPQHLQPRCGLTSHSSCVHSFKNPHLSPTLEAGISFACFIKLNRWTKSP